MRLLRVELARLRSRRAYWLLVVLALGGVLLAVGATVNDARPPTAGEVAEAQRLVDQELNQPYIQEELERCEESQADGETELYPPDFDCNDILPRLEYYLFYEEPNFVDDLQELIPPVALMLALAGALVGATFVGAEWAAGTMAPTCCSSRGAAGSSRPRPVQSRSGWRCPRWSGSAWCT